MSAIAGYVGRGDPRWLDAMLDAVAWRGDRTDRAVGPDVALGYRWWGGRPGKSPGIHRAADGAIVACAGTLAPAVPSPAADLDARLRAGRFDDLDGAFAAARVHDGRLELIRDPFGVRSLYVVAIGETLLFATELKQLLAVDEVPVALDAAALHKYLTFSFVPGEAVPVRGVRRLLPGHRLTRDAAGTRIAPWFTLREAIDPALADPHEAVRAVRRAGREAVVRRLNGEPEVGLYLSGGIDSSAVGRWLVKSDAKVHAFSLDFGEGSVEREEAARVAADLGVRHTWVPAGGADVLPLVDELVHRLDLPFGDGVTGPQYLLGRAARAAGLSAVFNGEGGDQLFGGWTSKPMVAAAVYGSDETPEEQYLRAYHRFYGHESELYTEAFAAETGGPGQRRALLAPHLEDDGTQSFLNRVRLTDLALKGCQNILPRAERTANAWGLDVRVPLFDRPLAELAFRLPPAMKLHGACEKYVLKLAMQGKLPDEIVWRRKFGMSVPVTDWLIGAKGTTGGPMTELVRDVLSPDALRRRGLFRPAYVARLLAGQDDALETRRRRSGEKLWALLMAELWMRRFIDARGKR